MILAVTTNMSFKLQQYKVTSECFNGDGKRSGTFPPYRCDALTLFEQAFDFHSHSKRTLPAPQRCIEVQSVTYCEQVYLYSILPNAIVCNGN